MHIISTYVLAHITENICQKCKTKKYAQMQIHVPLP